MYIFAEPVTDEVIQKIQSNKQEAIENFEREVMGLKSDKTDIEPVSVEDQSDRGWDQIHANVEEEVAHDEVTKEAASTEGSAEQVEGSDTADQAVIEGESESKVIDQDVTSGQTGVPGEGKETEGSGRKGDQIWLDAVDKEQEELESFASNRELLAMTLTIRNKVNDKYVQRPDNLSADGSWLVEYSLATINSSSRAWSLYGACQARRQRSLEKNDNEIANAYVQNLHKMSARGREWRRKENERDEEKGEVVLAPPSEPGV